MHRDVYHCRIKACMNSHHAISVFYRLLLEITAMRYGCLNHTSFATCAADQANWCTWHEDRSRCEMSYADADFVHLLLWSRTKIACKGSKLEQVVTCSYITSDTDCTGECAWAEGACYPAWYAPLVNKPQSIQSFKRQVRQAAEQQSIRCLCSLAAESTKWLPWLAAPNMAVTAMTALSTDHFQPGECLLMLQKSLHSRNHSWQRHLDVPSFA